MQGLRIGLAIFMLKEGMMYFPTAKVTTGRARSSHAV